MPIGDASYDVVNLNIDSLWSGGPFGATVSTRLSHLVPSLTMPNRTTRVAIQRAQSPITYLEFANSSSRTALAVSEFLWLDFVVAMLIRTDVTGLLGGEYEYGSYQVLANLTVAIANTSVLSDYRRELDLETALHTVSTDGIERCVILTRYLRETDEQSATSSALILMKCAFTISHQVQRYLRSRLALRISFSYIRLSIRHASPIKCVC